MKAPESGERRLKGREFGGEPEEEGRGSEAAAEAEAEAEQGRPAARRRNGLGWPPEEEERAQAGSWGTGRRAAEARAWQPLEGVTLFGPDLLGEKGPRPILTNKTEFVLFLCLFIFFTNLQNM
jgi:hypothetical protein